MNEIIIDGKNGRLGRICSYAAKQALQGNKVIIVNSGQVLISGDKKKILEKYRVLRAKGGHSQKGPKISVVAYKLLKRSVTRMLPNHREGIGSEAKKRIRCYNGIPEEFKDKKIENFENIPRKYITLNEVVKKL